MAPTALPAASAGASLELVVAFTYTVSDSRARSPYIAVWIESTAGVPVRTLTLQFEQGRGQRWLADLRRWYQADQSRNTGGTVDIASTKSSPTRLPGAQKLIWDGKDDQGVAVPAGEYVLSIEGAREHGPYSFIREPFTNTAAISKKLADSGELTAVSLEIRP